MGAKMTVFGGVVWASTPYNDVFLAALKEEVPAWARQWDKERKMWCVNATYERTLKVLLVACYGDFAEVLPAELGLGIDAGHRMPANEFAALHLLPSAPPELVRVAYKCLAKLYHPDLGGETEQMQALNAAYAALSEKVHV
jgi:hypothetical protein